MGDQDAFERILASLYDAMLDDALWPATSALIDDACGMQGNALMIRDGPPDDGRVTFVGFYYRGERRADWEREYLGVYHPIDERVPRLLQLPDSRWCGPPPCTPPGSCRPRSPTTRACPGGVPRRG